jgi:hypothetical protein
MTMDRLPAYLAAIAARRARDRRIRLAAELRDALPGDVAVSEEDDGVVLSGPWLGMRWLRDPALAVLRDVAGWLR